MLPVILPEGIFVIPNKEKLKRAELYIKLADPLVILVISIILTPIIPDSYYCTLRLLEYF